jgi:hypothetical protein
VIPALKLMMKVIQATYPDVYDTISFIEMPTFAVSWIITWFAHDLDNPKDIFRMYDFNIASHPATIIYIAAAVVIFNKDVLFDMEEEDMAIVHMIFQKLGSENFNLDEILQLAQKLIEMYPIDNLLYDNRNIGFQEDSPIMDEKIQIDAKLEQFAIETDQQIIKFEIPKWRKYKEYVTYSKLLAYGVTFTVGYFMVKHYLNS